MVSSQMQRGSNTTHQTPTHPSLRKEIRIIGMDFEDTDVCRQIVSIFKNMFRGAWPRWKVVPPEERKRLWDHFAGDYRWDPEIDAAVRKAWNNTMADRYADIMSQERTMAIKRAEKAGITVGSNYALIKAFKPSWIKQDFWDTMIDEEWNTDQWKNKSDKGKANKATLKNGMVAKHTCGSRKMSQTRRKMDLENGFTTTQVALYTKCHSRQLDDGTSEFITPTAENTIAEYKRLCFESFGPDESTHPLGDLELWTKAVGGKKKGRVRGAPSDPAYVVTGTSISSSSRSSSYFEESASAVKIQKLEEKVEELLTQTKKLEDLRKEEHLASQAREQEINKKMDEKLEAFQRMVLGKIGSS